MVYLTHGHLDVTYYVGVVSRFMTFPQNAHRDAIKHNVLCYMTGMLDFDILYKKGDDNKVTWFIDADWASDQEMRWSTTRYLFQDP